MVAYYRGISGIKSCFCIRNRFDLNYEYHSLDSSYWEGRELNTRYRYPAVFRIHDVLIRIGIRRSVPLDYGYESGSGLVLRIRIPVRIWIQILVFSSLLSRCQKVFFYFLLTIGTFASVFKGNKL